MKYRKRKVLAAALALLASVIGVCHYLRQQLADSVLLRLAVKHWSPPEGVKWLHWRTLAHTSAPFVNEACWHELMWSRAGKLECIGHVHSREREVIAMSNTQTPRLFKRDIEISMR
jgi:hypothetical protein